MRIAIVNDMLLAVEAMRRVVIGSGEHHVAWVARDGAQAVEQCAKDRPDLVLMDLIMPVMDGVEATRQIMEATPCPIVVVTANVNDNAAKAFEAMGAGALDAVNTPVLGGASSAKALLAKIDTIRRLTGPVGIRKPATVVPVGRPADFKHDQLVAIGASAGGPTAVAKVLAELPADFPAAIVVVQHVDEQFAAGLCDWLASHTALHVRLAKEGDQPVAGTVLLGARETHLVFNNGTHLGYSPQPESSFHPSVDVFFRSITRHWQGKAVGVLLTGMGRDGAEGLKALRDHGWHTIAQDKESSAVYGMPKAAAELNAASEILSLEKIAGRLRSLTVNKP